MVNRYNRILLPLFFLYDLFIVAFAYFDAYYMRFGEIIPADPRYISAFIYIIILWSVLSFLFKTYHEHRGESLTSMLTDLLLSKALFIMGLSLYLFTTKSHYFSRSFMAIFFALDTVLITIFHIVRHFIMIKHRLYGRNYKKILLLGDLPKNGTSSIHDFFDPITGHKITKHLPLFEMLRDIHKVPTLIKQELASSDYDILLVASPLEFGKYLYKVIDIAENNGLRVAFYPHFVSSINHKLEVSYIDDFPLINVRAEPLQFLPNRLIKRLIDLSVASLTFVLFYWWFYLIVGSIIKLTSEGPIIFKQKRIGADNKKFWFYKFRTMKNPENEEEAINGARGITHRDDPRVTKIGNFLRKTNLDELPQIINVLKGDMSIVGPRPHMLEEDLEVRKRVKKYMVRQFVRPGITGWAAVNGFRGGTDDMDLMEERVQHDIYYIESWTPLFDLKIIFKTIWQMITFHIPNAY